ncbi:hypothetical protein QBC40DRAFT_277529 [Triangularia verruculosa]|uniref:Acetylserotonin methytransferase-like protein n=1 Tax=Triangularia verruculosa TaxID=2587418 RepID=A0AAN6XLG5_9PEZI|nr:hypothetical protein QBC40DRAFT_277529 [Triangularia verruculosa]
MSAPPPSGPGGFSLFPNTATRPPSRSQNQQRPPTRSGTPQESRPSISAEPSPPRAPRIRRDSSVREGKQRVVSTNPWQHALDARESQRRQYPQEAEAGPSNAAIPVPDPVVETAYAQPVNDPPQRCETAFSEAQTLVRSNSARSRSSIAKPPLAYTPAGQSSSSGEPSSSSNPPQLRSIFPTYNPELPLDRQEYYPKEASPTHIPQAAISRPLYSPRRERAPTVTSNHNPTQSPPQGPLQSPAPTAASAQTRWPNPSGTRHHEPAVIPPVSSTEELRALWKVTNGWKASSLEGRPFCLKLTACPDAPVYTLSSSSNQPFYCLRVDPTSASALVSLSRYDPNKPFKQSPPSPNGSPSSSPTPGGVSQSPNIINSPPPTIPPSTSSSSTLRTSISLRTSKTTRTLQHNAKNWLEVLTTSLTPPSARNENNGGLVAHLWPSAAARLVADRSNDATTVALAQQESARLVYDPDSGNHFLVHPALAMPFCVTIERNPVFSRTEYTLEHLESPFHLAKLTRDGTGQGWFEVDTSIAAKIEAVYLVDVVVAALVLVAHGDEGYTSGRIEVFEPPPVVFGSGGGGNNGSVISGGGDRRSSKSSRRGGDNSRASIRREEKQRKKELKKQRGKRDKKKRMEQFEIDLESQDSGEFSNKRETKEEKLPAVLRALVWLIKIFFKCLIGSLTLVFKCLGGIINGLARCCGLGKL